MPTESDNDPIPDAKRRAREDARRRAKELASDTFRRAAAGVATQELLRLLDELRKHWPHG